MNRNTVLLVSALCIFLPTLAQAADAGNATPKYSAATIFTSNSTVNLVPTTNGAGNVRGISCIFPSNALGASVKVQFTVNGGTATSFIIDPTNLEREADLAGQFVSGWIPMNIQFTSSIRIQLNNTNLGTANINCWASWGLD